MTPTLCLGGPDDGFTYPRSPDSSDELHVFSQTPTGVTESVYRYRGIAGHMAYILDGVSETPEMVHRVRAFYSPAP